MRGLVILFIASTALATTPVEARLSKENREELFQRVEQMCKNASSVGQVITYEGSLDAGATLKVIGVGATGKVNKEQWQNIEQKYGEFRTNPVICNFEMIKAIEPLFSRNDCRQKQYGIEKYQREFDVTRQSNWMGGGFSQKPWCDQVTSELRGQHPEGEFSYVSSRERSESKCSPFNCPQYMYWCTIHVKTDPLYKEDPSGC